MSKPRSSVNAVLVSIERLLDAVDVVYSGKGAGIDDLQSMLRITSNRSREIVRALAFIGLTTTDAKGGIIPNWAMERFVQAWELGDATDLSEVLRKYEAYNRCLEYLASVRYCPTIKGVPEWLNRSAHWRYGRANRREFVNGVTFALTEFGIGNTTNWDSFLRSLIRKAGARKEVLSNFHLVEEDPEFDQTARYVFQWITMTPFGINPASFDQMGLWAQTLSMAYRTPDMLYWGGERPSPDAFSAAVNKVYRSLSPSEDFVLVGLVWDTVCKALFMSPNLFESMMLDYIENNSRFVSISGAVSLERKGVGTVFYCLKPRSDGPPWLERRWLADGLRTPQGNIKFIRLEKHS